MPIKSILLHMAADERHAERLGTAVELARRFGAHLDILFVATPVSMPASIVGRGASYAFLAEATAIAHEKAEVIHRRVQDVCAGTPYAWTVAEGDHVSLLAERAAYADLAVVTQSHPEHLEDRVRLHLPDRLPLQSPCPTLVLPWDPRPATVATDLVVAWKNTRESSLAVRGALPLLAAARRLSVLAVDDPGERRAALAERAAEGAALVAFLGRHGVAAEARRTEGEDAGEAILGFAREIGADGLVMGSYGHSRLREVVIGGATRHVLGHMDLPVVMAH
jgi:nucleotide-binding universal stress UspA family protein